MLVAPRCEEVTDELEKRKGISSKDKKTKANQVNEGEECEDRCQFNI